MMNVRAVFVHILFVLALHVSGISGQGDDVGAAMDSPATVRPLVPFSGSLYLDESLSLNYEANVETEMLSVELILEGRAWLAIGLSDDGLMTGGIAVVGLPETSVAEKYSLDGYSLSSVQPVAQELKTLIDSTVEQTEERTTLRYSRNFEDEGDLSVDIESGVIRFIYAYGTSNTLGWHGVTNRGSVEVDVRSSIEDVPAASPEVDIPTTSPEPDTAVPMASPVISGDLSPFSGSFDLDENLVLNYEGNTETEILSIELILEGKAWLSIGLSDDGLMTGAIAVVGLPDTSIAEKYTLGGYDRSSVQPVEQGRQTLLDATVEQTDEQTILRYKQNFNDEGDLSIDAESGLIRFIYAYGESNILAYHTFSNKGSAEVNVYSGEGLVDAVIDTKNKWKAHGLLMGLAWGVFVPVAIACSLLRHVLPLPPGAWYKLHMGSNFLASLMTVCGIGIAVSAINDEQCDGADHFSRGTHHKIGGLILLFTALQVMNGFLRPHAPGPHTKMKKQEGEEDVENTEDSATSKHEEHEEKSKFRSIWEVIHRVVGVTTLAMAWYNCSSGIDLYEGRYPMDMNLPLVFLIIVGAIAGSTLMVYGATFNQQ